MGINVSVLDFCLKMLKMRGFHALLRKVPPLAGVKSRSAAVLFCFLGLLKPPVTVILLEGIVDLLGNRYVIEQFQRVERDFVKRLDVSLSYGVCKKPVDSG